MCTFASCPRAGTWRAERTEGWENQVGGSNDWLPVGGLAPRIELSNLVSSLAIDLCLCGNTYDGHGQESVMWYMSKHGFTSSTASFRSSSMPHCSAAHVSFCQTSCLKSFVRGGKLQVLIHVASEVALACPPIDFRHEAFVETKDEVPVSGVGKAMRRSSASCRRR